MADFSLAFLTVPELTPIEAIEIAKKVGFEKVGLRLLPAIKGETEYPLLTDPRLLRNVSAALDEQGVSVGDVELIRIREDVEVTDYYRFFEVAQFLGAKYVTVVNDDPNLLRAAENFARLCEVARPYSLVMNLEAIPWTALRDLHEAKNMLRTANQSNAALLIDAFHFYRRSTAVDVLDDIPLAWLRLFQICDAPKNFDSDVHSIRNEARNARLFPGEGDLDLTTLLQKLPSDLTLSVEVPNALYLSRFCGEERARIALRSARQALAIAGIRSDG